MGRFYETAEGKFIDVLPEQSGTRATSKGSSSGDGDGLLSSAGILPEDMDAFDQQVQGYRNEIDGIAQQLQSNPDSVDKHMPRIRQLKREIEQNASTGAIGQMRRRYKRFHEISDTLKEQFKDDAFVQQNALDQIGISPLGEAIGSTNLGITAPDFVTPTTADQETKWMNTTLDNLEDSIIKEAQRRDIDVSKYDTIIELANVIGLDQDQIEGALASTLPRNFVRGADQFNRLRGIQDVDESPMKGGVLDTSTFYGGKIREIGKNFARKKIANLDRFKITDEVGLFEAKERIKTREEGKREAQKEAITGKAATDFADFLFDRTMQLHDKEGFEKAGEVLMESDFLALSQPLGTGENAPRITKIIWDENTEEPIMFVENPNVDDYGTKTIEHLEMPLNLSSMQSVIPDKVFSQLAGKFKKAGLIDEATGDIDKEKIKAKIRGEKPEKKEEKKTSDSDVLDKME